MNQSRAIPADAPAYAKLDPSGSDLRMARDTILLILSVAEIDVIRIIDLLSADIDRAQLIKEFKNHMIDCASDVSGPIERAAEALDEAPYEGGTLRGPFYRHRGA